MSRSDEALFEAILKTGASARSGRLGAADLIFVRETAPQALAAYPHIGYPARLRHPGGFGLSGASIRSHVRASLLMGARRAHGPRYAARSAFYARVEADTSACLLAAHVARGVPLGVFCCAECTLAFLPALEAGCFERFDGRQAAVGVRALIAGAQPPFGVRVRSVARAWATGSGAG